MISYAFGLAVLILAVMLVQLGVVAALAMVCVLAVIVSALFAVVIYFITAGRGIFTERKPESHF